MVFFPQYHPVPVMYGAAKDEGSFIYGTLYTEWMVKNNQSMVKQTFMKFLYGSS